MMMNKYLLKYLKGLSISLMLVVMFSACEIQEITISEIEFFIAKEWKIKAVFQDGEPVTDTDLTQYRLELNDDFTFTKTSISGQDNNGTWQLTSGLTQVVLFVDEPHEERWLLLDLEIRSLEMRLLQRPDKPQLDIRYILEPVKGR
jgi:hypothetical protein